MSVTMVRSNGKPTFDLKAGETKAATLFWNEFHQAALPNGRLHQCELWASTSASIVDHISIMDANPWRLEHDQYMERLFSMQWKSFTEIQYPMGTLLSDIQAIMIMVIDCMSMIADFG